MTGIIYGSSMGNTENAAKYIAEALGGEIELKDAVNLNAADLERYDRILLGSSTWGMGELQDDWNDKIDLLKSRDFSGKKIGFFGCGDQESYSDTFADALGILYETVKDSGANFIGQWPQGGYTLEESAALIGDSFVGLVLDEDNQPELTQERIEGWVKTL